MLKTMSTVALILLSAAPAAAQSGPRPDLAKLLQGIFGPGGLVVNSEARLPDGSTHSAHFNSAFQSNFRQFNIALASQLTSLPVPSPASGFTYHFDASTGTFVRSTRSYGPILADRAETIGARKLAVGYAYQFFSFNALEGVNLGALPAVFTHDDHHLGGGRSDVVVTTNSIEATAGQFTGMVTFGVTDRIDVSVAVPFNRTRLTVRSAAEIHRIGTGTNTLVHFFQDETTPGGVGNRRQFDASGTAAGLGDVTLRAKAAVARGAQTGLAVGLDTRLPTGKEEELLGSGAMGIKPFAVVSFVLGRFSPHMSVGYQWNGSSVLAGDVASGVAGDLPDRFLYAVGADMSVTDRVSVALDVLGERVSRSPRLLRQPFTGAGAAGSVTFDDIGFGESAFATATGALGMKVRLAADLLANFNLRFQISNNGLTHRVAPLVGVEYGF